MKNTDPIQLVILIIALLLGYQALQTFPYLLWLLYHWFDEGLTLADRFGNVAINFLYLIFYIAGLIILIKKSKTIAQQIGAEASFSTDIKIILRRADILYATLVVLGSYILITKLPKLLVKLYTYIRESNKPLSYDGPNYILPGESIPEQIITIMLATVLLVYAKTITEYLTRHLPEDVDIETIGTNHDETK